MFALAVQLSDDEAYQRQLQHPLQPIIHVDSGVQTEETFLEQRPSLLQPESLLSVEAPVDDLELTSVMDGASSSADGGPSCNKNLSSHPRRSGGASPWLVGDGVSEEEEEDELEAGEGLGDSEEGEEGGGPSNLELAQLGFIAGHPNGELQVGSIGFYRYDQPAGVFGLRPPPLRSNVVCITAVPSWLSSGDLIRFLGGYARYVRHMRLLRDASMPHRHMLLLQFGSPSFAERFRADYHAKRFNSLEPEVALVVHVAQVAFAPPQPRSPKPIRGADVHVQLHVRSVAGKQQHYLASEQQTSPISDGAGLSNSEMSSEGAEKGDRLSTLAHAGQTCLPCGEDITLPLVRLQLWTGLAKNSQMSSLNAAASMPSPPLAPPSVDALAALQRARRGGRACLPPLPQGVLMSNAIELPGCPVCLERLDPSITGIVTIVCDHTFHCECLRRWADSSCPVCRHVSDDSQGATSCEVCGTLDSLWICLVCGHVGCGRYTGCGSGVHHNESTGHNFAMELSTQRVWDYKGDNYVHRLIQNKVDGKLVELPDPRQTGGTSASDIGGHELDPASQELKQRGQEEQYEAVVHEYSLLLTGQLEVQRRHYDERLAELDRNHKRHLFELEQDLREREDALRCRHVR